MKGWFVFSFFRSSRSKDCGSGGGEESSGGKCPPPDSNPLETSSLEKIAPACQHPIRQVRAADSSSTNAVSFSSARTTKRFPSSRWASTIQIVRPLELIAETQPQLQRALLRLPAMISQSFTRCLYARLRFSWQRDRNARARGRISPVLMSWPVESCTKIAQRSYTRKSQRRY